MYIRVRVHPKAWLQLGLGLTPELSLPPTSSATTASTGEQAIYV